MFALPPTIVLMVLFYLRPQEIFVVLQRVPLLYLALALAVFGLVVDLKLGLIRPQATPALKWAILFIVWCVVTVAVRAPKTLGTSLIELGIIFVPFLVIAHGVQSFRAFHAVAGTIWAITFVIAAVCVHQRYSPHVCLPFEGSVPLELPQEVAEGTPVGRPCAEEAECYIDNPEPMLDFECEREGLFGTTSIAGRVRYRGKLQDPNEVALALSMGLPFAFALLQLRRTRLRLVMVVVTVLLVAMAVKFTGSRGGLLVLAVVLGVYAVRRYKKKAILLAGVMAVPLLALLLVMSRGRKDSDESTQERIECQYVGMEMWRSSPLVGVGFGQFNEHHYLTAHNSYVLAPAELGTPGFFIWLALVFVSFKIGVTALLRSRHRPEARAADVWATALLASLSAMAVGVLFLSFNYHVVLWILLGIVGAFHSACKTHDPDWQVTFGLLDFGAVAALTVVLISFEFVFTRVMM